MNPRQRRTKIHQRQLRRRKNVSLTQHTPFEIEEIKRREMEWHPNANPRITGRTLKEIEDTHSVSFDALFNKLFRRFPDEKIRVLNEGCGKSDFKEALMGKSYGKKLQITNSDIIKWTPKVDAVVNILDLTKKFGEDKFHLVVSTFGGAANSPFPEKALFQVASALKPGGIGIINTGLSGWELNKISKRIGIKIQKKEEPDERNHNPTLIFMRLARQKIK